jgi:hypothetical protein
MGTNSDHIIFDMEEDLNNAAHASTALELAIQGIDRLSITPEQEKMALEWLAFEARFAAHKARAAWYRAHEDDGQEITSIRVVK